MKSMTGFGRASGSDGDVTVRCELKSVNHKSIDVRARLDGRLGPVEQTLTAKVRDRFSRGRVELNLEVQLGGAAARRVRFDKESAARLADELWDFQHQRPKVEGPLTIDAFLTRGELFVVEEGEVDPARLESLALEVLDDAMDDLHEARTREGAGLADELDRRLASCATHVAAIADRAEGVSARLRKKLEQRLSDADLQLPVSEERIAQEIALLADRADVAEELARLDLHLSRFREIADGDGPVGRKLDFLCQELNREANTVGSKCSDAETAHTVVELKSEIERIREQVQNVE
jgi:uncharacterized protein (TIGR00255 family)